MDFVGDNDWGINVQESVDGIKLLNRLVAEIEGTLSSRSRVDEASPCNLPVAGASTDSVSMDPSDPPLEATSVFLGVELVPNTQSTLADDDEDAHGSSVRSEKSQSVFDGVVIEPLTQLECDSALDASSVPALRVRVLFLSCFRFVWD